MEELTTAIAKASPIEQRTQIRKSYRKRVPKRKQPVSPNNGPLPARPASSLLNDANLPGGGRHQDLRSTSPLRLQTGLVDDPQSESPDPKRRLSSPPLAASSEAVDELSVALCSSRSSGSGRQQADGKSGVATAASSSAASVSTDGVKKCVACGAEILDQTVLAVGGKGGGCGFFHCACLKCSECGLELEHSSKCFMRRTSILCQDCYNMYVDIG